MSRERLAKLLGMLGSDFDGERANAARMIAAMAKEANKGVADFVMGGGGSERIVYRDRVETVYRDRPCPVCAQRQHKTSYERDRTDDTGFYTEDDLRNYRKPKPEQKTHSAKRPLLAGLRHARDFPEHLSGFEAEFIDDCLAKYHYDYELSDKQAKVARRIIAKVNAYEGDPLI